MDWPDLVKALKPLGFVEYREGHVLFHQDVTDFRKVRGGFNGEAEVYARGRILFFGPYAEVAEYLKGGQINDGA